MQTTVCTRFKGVHLVAGASHWVQQEQAEEITERMLWLLRNHALRA